MFQTYASIGQFGQVPVRQKVLCFGSHRKQLSGQWQSCLLLGMFDCEMDLCVNVFLICSTSKVFDCLFTVLNKANMCLLYILFPRYRPFSYLSTTTPSKNIIPRPFRDAASLNLAPMKNHSHAFSGSASTPSPRQYIWPRYPAALPIAVLGYCPGALPLAFREGQSLRLPEKNSVHLGSSVLWPECHGKMLEPG